MDIAIEPKWEELIKRLMIQKGIAILIGAADSGKSTLAKYLIKRLVSANIKTSLVDSDIGQSTIGLPGTISMKIFNSVRDLEDFHFKKMFFIGSTNPAKKFHLMIYGTKKMVDICKQNSEVVIIDTTGLVSGEVGKALKIAKIKAINPRHVIAIQRSDELEHILSLIEDTSVYRIKASTMAKVRSRIYRIRYRKEKFANYFDKTKISEFSLKENEAPFFYNNKPFKIKESNFRENLLIGLNHNEDTIALGVITEILDNSIQFISPIKSINNVNRVLFGDIYIS